MAFSSIPDGNLRVSFLDVGQGEAVLIQKGGRQILVDGGPGSRPVTRGLGRKMPFWDRTIDMVVLSHPSADHVTGLIEVLERYRVEKVVYNGADFPSSVYWEWLGLVEEKNIERIRVAAGQTIDFGNGLKIEILNPPDTGLAGTRSDVDNNGLVLKVVHGDVSFLLTADIMWEAELALVHDRACFETTVLKVAHHGSTTSTTAEFLAVANPALAVISVGGDNPFGHPSRSVMDSLEEKLGRRNIFRTDRDGTIDFITDGSRLWVETEFQR